jgi:hypothetical protein
MESSGKLRGTLRMPLLVLLLMGVWLIISVVVGLGFGRLCRNAEYTLPVKYREKFRERRTSQKEASELHLV